jgi:hypothetical protein
VSGLIGLIYPGGHEVNSLIGILFTKYSHLAVRVFCPRLPTGLVLADDDASKAPPGLLYVPL